MQTSSAESGSKSCTENGNVHIIRLREGWLETKSICPGSVIFQFIPMRSLIIQYMRISVGVYITPLNIFCAKIIITQSDDST